MAIPTIPTVFLLVSYLPSQRGCSLTASLRKPSTSLGDPWPEPTLLPKLTQADDTGDYESELAVVIGKTCKDVSEEDALDYVLGYTAANDVSSRASQFSQTQWCFSKGFDGSCPLGPTLVSKELIPDASKLRVRGLKNGDVMQDCETTYVFTSPDPNEHETYPLT